MLHTKDESPKAILLEKIRRAENDIRFIHPTSPKLNHDDRVHLKEKLKENLAVLDGLKLEYEKTTGESYKHTFKSSSSGLSFLSAKRTSSKEAEINSTITATP